MDQLLNRHWFRVAQCISLCEKSARTSRAASEVELVDSCSLISHLAEFMSRFASEFTPATATAMWSANLCIFSDATPVSKSWEKVDVV